MPSVVTAHGTSARAHTPHWGEPSQVEASGAWAEQALREAPAAPIIAPEGALSRSLALLPAFTIPRARPWLTRGAGREAAADGSAPLATGLLCRASLDADKCAVRGLNARGVSHRKVPPFRDAQALGEQVQIAEEDANICDCAAGRLSKPWEPKRSPRKSSC